MPWTSFSRRLLLFRQSRIVTFPFLLINPMRGITDFDVLFKQTWIPTEKYKSPCLCFEISVCWFRADSSQDRQTLRLTCENALTLKEKKKEKKSHTLSKQRDTWSNLLQAHKKRVKICKLEQTKKSTLFKEVQDDWTENIYMLSNKTKIFIALRNAQICTSSKNTR